MTTLLCTGSAGFIGHHFCEHILMNTDYNIVFLDKLDCAGNLNRIIEIKNWEQYKKRCKWIFHDLRAEISSQTCAQIGKVDIIIHMAASTHVDRSIVDPLSFVWDNVIGTAHILEYARHSDISKMLYFGTDEIFGSAPEGVFYKEWDRYKSGNPYSATKAGGEELCLAYHNTYKLPVICMHTMNAFGQRQHPEKYIPMTIAKVRAGKEVIIHSNSDRTKAGSRFYIHARNIADATLFVIDNGVVGDKYNIVGEREVDNLELAKLIASIQGKELTYIMTDFHSARPGHDLRYALDGSKMAAMGWKPKVSFENSLDDVVRWTLDNPRWLLS